MTEKDKIIEEKLKRIAKQIDPDNTFLNECEDIIKNRFSKTEKDIIWMWDTENDKEQAEQLEKRVKQKIIEEIEKWNYLGTAREPIYKKGKRMSFKDTNRKVYRIGRKDYEELLKIIGEK